MSQMKITWHSSGRTPQCKPNPKYPNGIDIDKAGQRVSCIATLPYPAECIGSWEILCEKCGHKAMVTAAGRTDDPRSIKLPCRSV